MRVQNKAGGIHPSHIGGGRDARMDLVQTTLENHHISLAQANPGQLAANRAYGAGMMGDIGMLQGMGGMPMPGLGGYDPMSCAYGMGDMMMCPDDLGMSGSQQSRGMQQDQMMMMIMMQSQQHQMIAYMMMMLMQMMMMVQGGQAPPTYCPQHPGDIDHIEGPEPVYPEHPEVPELPETPEVPETPEAPETPEVPQPPQPEGPSERDNAIRLRAQANATRIHEAVDGLGTDEEALIRVLVGLNNEDLEALKTAYQEMFGRSLDDVIRAETSGDFEKTLLGLTRPRPNENEAVSANVLQSDVRALHQAMAGLGTDEATLIEILTSRSRNHLEQLKNLYQQTHNRSLAEAVSSETSGDFRRALLAILSAPVPEAPAPGPVRPAPGPVNPGPEPVEPGPAPAPTPTPVPAPNPQPEAPVPNERENALRIEAQSNATRLHEAADGLGTDEAAFIQVLSRLNNEQLQALKTAYQEMYGRDLDDVIRSETSGDFEKTLLGLTRPRPNENEPVSAAVIDSDVRALHGAMEGWGTDEATLIEILTSRSRTHISRLKEAYQQTHNRSLADHVSSETSGDFRTTLLAVLG